MLGDFRMRIAFWADIPMAERWNANYSLRFNTAVWKS